MIYGLIPAAGHSTRMGRPKLALPLGDRTVIEHVVKALRDGGVECVLVVIGPHVPELVPLAEKAGAQTHYLAEPTPDMRCTVETGLRWIEANWQPTNADRWLLVPGDHPTLDAEVVRQVLQFAANLPPDAIVIPTCDGNRGHPALVGWSHVAALRRLPPDAGLNRYFRQSDVQVHELPLSSRATATDLDTPEDYHRLCEQWPTA